MKHVLIGVKSRRTSSVENRASIIIKFGWFLITLEGTICQALKSTSFHSPYANRATYRYCTVWARPIQTAMPTEFRDDTATSPEFTHNARDRTHVDSHEVPIAHRDLFVLSQASKKGAMVSAVHQGGASPQADTVSHGISIEKLCPRRQ